jgi:rare lipoprotein A
MIRTVSAAALCCALSACAAVPAIAGDGRASADFLAGIRSIDVAMTKDKPGAGRVFAGLASFYGSESGSRTASGQRFNPGAMTAAHRSLPFGTRLRVTYNGRSVVVTINDRGPFIRGRVLDLSSGAARAIGLTKAGVGRVVCEIP